jgi:hypothetical protein
MLALASPEIDRSLLAGFEDEKTYIAKRLRELRRKLREFSNNSRRVPVSGGREDSCQDWRCYCLNSEIRRLKERFSVQAFRRVWCWAELRKIWIDLL